jgi:hypothetical protein
MLAHYLIGHHTVTEARARGWDEEAVNPVVSPPQGLTNNKVVPALLETLRATIG